MIRTFYSILLVVSLASSMQEAALAEVTEPPVVTVHVESGRQFSGYVDAATGEKLVLRSEAVATAIWRTIDWRQVRFARFGTKRLSASQLQARAAELSSSHQRRSYRSPTSTADQAEGTFAEQASAGLAAKRRATSIRISAATGNWDGDVEQDGLVVEVHPLDRFGELTDVGGTVTVDLIGQRPASSRSRYTYYRGHPFPRLGRWTRKVEASEIGVNGYVLRLPLQAIDPQVNTDIGAYGIVHVRMAVPGHGVFEASTDFTRLRPFSPIRDDLEHLSGRRYFAGERRGR